MNITKENVDDLNAVITISFEEADYKESYTSALSRTRKNVNMPGFRPGKVPMGMVKKMYGKSILADELNRLINQNIQEYITENKLPVLGNPLPKEDEGDVGDWDNPGAFEFKFELGLAPEFEVTLSSKDKFTYNSIKIDDELLDKEVNNLARRYGKLSTAEEASGDDMLMGDFVQLDENNEILEGGIMHQATIALEYIEDEESKNKLIGAKVGDIIVVDPKKVSRGGSDTAAMLGIDASEVDDLNSMFNFRVGEIRHMEAADINQELFDKLFGEGNVTSEEEFRTRLGDDMGQMFVRDTDTVFMNSVTEKLLEDTNLSLPDEFLKRWIVASNEKPVTIEQVEEEYENYSKGLRWQLIENKLIQDNELTVEQDEILDYAKGLLAAQWKQYGLPEPEGDELTEQATKMLANQEEGKRIYDMLYNQKVLQFVKDTVKLESQELSYDEFVKLASGK